LQSLYEGRPSNISRVVSASPRGGSYAIYASDRWKLGDRSILEWGLRWDDQTYTDLSSDSQLSPRMSFLFQLGENTELRMSAGRYFQSQAIQSLQIEDGVTNFWPAQRADQLILGARHLFDNAMSVRVELFIKELGQIRPRFENLFDPLGLMPELQRDRVLLAPSGARARGLEISADQAIGDLGWWGSYTWSRVTDRIDGADVPRSWDQRHSVQAGFEWNKEHWNFSAAASVHSGWPTTGLTLDDDGFVVPEARNAERHGTYASLDFRVSRRFDVKRGSLLAFLEVSNALNRKNECCLDWDIIENNAGDDALERGKDFWMPRLPAIGILWEF
jgi:outer membrane receptor protein involved in Fe transport